MDQAQNRAVAALQPFLHLTLTTKSPSPRILADFITRATSAPGTYIFAELLRTPAIQSLRAADTPQAFRSYYTVLEIFSSGTLADYQSTPAPTVLHPNQLIVHLTRHTQPPHLDSTTTAQTHLTDPPLPSLRAPPPHLRLSDINPLPPLLLRLGDPHHRSNLQRPHHRPTITNLQPTNRAHDLCGSPPRPLSKQLTRDTEGASRLGEQMQQRGG